MSRALSVHRMADEPHLAENLELAVEGAFPAFFAHDRLWNEVFPEVVTTFPDLQLLVAVDGEIAGMLNSVAFSWDGSVEDLPRGEHDVMLRSIREHRDGVVPNTLCGIQAVLLPAFVGSGFVS